MGGNTSSLLGIAICIVGNTTISLALNIQKLAHVKLDQQKSPSKDKPNEQSSPTSGPANLTSRRSKGTPSPIRELDEDVPLLEGESVEIPDSNVRSNQPRLLLPADDNPKSSKHILIPIEIEPPVELGTEAGAESNRKVRPQVGKKPSSNKSRKKPRVDKEFLNSKLWWLGLAMLNLGELGNFVAYAFAPASLVAPLGTVALVANCFLAPLIVKEPFRKQDLLGCLLAITGGVTVVWASKLGDKQLYPDELLKAICHPVFIAYAIVSIVTGSVLAALSRTRYGDRYVMIDMGLCAVAGGFTVLSTKAFSSMLSLLFLDTFRHWITYPILVILISTALIQVNFVNKSLQRFESRVVVPTQFCSFSLSAIIGSAVLYREFDGVTPSEFLNFLFGILLSALGVYVLTRETKEDASSTHGQQGTGPSTSDYRSTRIVFSGDLPVTGSNHQSLPQTLRGRSLSVSLSGRYLLAASPSSARSPIAQLIKPNGGALPSPDTSEIGSDTDSNTDHSNGEDEDEDEDNVEEQVGQSRQYGTMGTVSSKSRT